MTYAGVAPTNPGDSHPAPGAAGSGGAGGASGTATGTGQPGTIILRYPT